MDAPQWTGGPDDYPQQPEEPRHREFCCEQCGKWFDEGDVLHTPMGDFCSDECATQWEAEFVTYMAKEGHTVSQPVLLVQEGK